MAEQGLPPDPRGCHRLLRRDTDAGSVLSVRYLVQSMNVFVVVDSEQHCMRCSLFPRSVIAGDDRRLESDEMLTMLYSMAIMR